MISPRELYRKSHPEELKALVLLVNEPWFARAVTYAYSALACNGATTEKLDGAELLIGELKAMTEEEKEAPIMPDKSALASYDHPGQLPPEEPKA